MDSVGVGGTINGNVITGAGGNLPGGADIFSDAPTRINNITFGGQTFTVPVGGRTITTANGTLVIQQNGDYTFTSAYQNKVVTANGNTPAQIDTTTPIPTWGGVFNVYGFDGTAQSNALFGGNQNNTASISLITLDGTSAGRVSVRNGTGNNDDGIGVENNPTTGANARTQSGENLVIDVGYLTNDAIINLTRVRAGDTVAWKAYDANGNFVDGGTLAGNGAENVNRTITASGSYRYIVLSHNGRDFLVNGLTATPDLSSITPDQFTYTLIDGDGSISNAATLTISSDSTILASQDTATVFEAGLSNGTRAGRAPASGTATWW